MLRRLSAAGAWSWPGASRGSCAVVEGAGASVETNERATWRRRDARRRPGPLAGGRRCLARSARPAATGHEHGGGPREGAEGGRRAATTGRAPLPLLRLSARADAAEGGERAAGGGSNELRRLVAGALSAVVARTAVAPLERIKLEYMLNHSRATLVRTATNIVSNEGPLGFWRGNGVNLLRIVPYKALNYFTFDTYWRIAQERLGLEGAAANAGRLGAGAAAGITSVVACYPLDVVRTRLLTEGGIKRYGSFGGVVRTMLRQEGATSLYRGLLPAVLSMAPNGAVYYGAYDWLKHAALSSEPPGTHPAGASDFERLGAPRALAFGALAGIASEASTYPLEVVRRRLQMQTGRAGDPRSVQRMLHAFRAIVRQNGVPGLYAGLLPSVLQVLPSAALGYYSYELTKHHLGVRN